MEKSQESHTYTPFTGPRRPSGSERVFTDGDGHTWTALTFPMAVGRAAGSPEAPGLVVVFTCTSDARFAQRATGAPAATRLTDVPEATMRAWLEHAPRLGRLT